MTKQEVHTYFVGKGLKPDAFGHFHVDNSNIGGRHLRYKLGLKTLRKEAKIEGGWVRLKSGFYGKLNISPVTGLLRGLDR